jgi:myo-inositol-1(or 4)-monophosphatase
MSRDPDPFLRAELRRLVEDAGAHALSYFGRVERELKSDGTPVTAADRAVEERLVEALSRAFPGEAIRSEEGTRVEGRDGAAVWYVDPIDGTGAFLSGLAHWGPTVCRVVGGELQAGAFYTPRVRELWYAERGTGAWRDGVRLPPLVEPDAIRTDDVLFAPSRFHRVQPVPWSGKIRALGSGAAHLALVAAGGGLCTVIPQWALWDVGCGALLIREVGGVIWDAHGVPVAPESVPPNLPLLAGVPLALSQLVAGQWAASALRR